MTTTLLLETRRPVPGNLSAENRRRTPVCFPIAVSVKVSEVPREKSDLDITSKFEFHYFDGREPELVVKTSSGRLAYGKALGRVLWIESTFRTKDDNSRTDRSEFPFVLNQVRERIVLVVNEVVQKKIDGLSNSNSLTEIVRLVNNIPIPESDLLSD